MLGPVRYLLYTSDIPKMEYSKIATFANDMVILAVEATDKETTRKLQSSVDQIIVDQTLGIRPNESKSTNINLKNR